MWFDRFVAGEMAGNAWSEVGSDIDLPRTVLRPRADGSYRLDGTKYYTTGTIFAEWTDVHARLARPGHPDEVEDPTAIALVDTRDPGVRTVDDWNGFGQKGTGSGTTTFDNVGVPADHVLPFEDRFPYQTAFYQLNLLATLTGIAKAALRDVVDAVQKRTRNFSHANAPRVRDDAQVLALVGGIAAAVYAAEAATLRVAGSIQAVADAPLAERRGDRGPRRDERDRVVHRPGRGLRAGPAGHLRPLRRPGCLRDRPAPRARPPLAQRPDGRLAQPAHPQGPGRRRPRRQRHAAAVRLVDRRDAPSPGLGRHAAPPRRRRRLRPTGHAPAPEGVEGGALRCLQGTTFHPLDIPARRRSPDGGSSLLPLSTRSIEFVLEER